MQGNGLDNNGSELLINELISLTHTYFNVTPNGGEEVEILQDNISKLLFDVINFGKVEDFIPYDHIGEIISHKLSNAQDYIKNALQQILSGSSFKGIYNFYVQNGGYEPSSHEKRNIENQVKFLLRLIYSYTQIDVNSVKSDKKTFEKYKSNLIQIQSNLIYYKKVLNQNRWKTKLHYEFSTYNLVSIESGLKSLTNLLAKYNINTNVRKRKKTTAKTVDSQDILKNSKLIRKSKLPIILRYFPRYKYINKFYTVELPNNIDKLDVEILKDNLLERIDVILKNESSPLIFLHENGDFYSTEYIRILEQIIETRNHITFIGITTINQDSVIGKEIKRVNLRFKYNFNIIFL